MLTDQGHGKNIDFSTFNKIGLSTDIKWRQQALICADISTGKSQILSFIDDIYQGVEARDL